MKNIIIELIKKEAVEHQNSSAITSVLESLLAKIDNTDLHKEYLKTILEVNASIIIRKPIILENILKITIYPESLMPDEVENGWGIVSDYEFDYSNTKYRLTITDNKEIDLFVVSNDSLLNKIFNKKIDKPNYSYITTNDKTYIVTMNEDLLEEYKDEVKSAISNSEKESASINFENNRYGFGLNGCKFDYYWSESNPIFVATKNDTFRVDGVGEKYIREIIDQLFTFPETVSYIDSLINYCEGYGICISHLEYKEHKGSFVAYKDNKVFISSEPTGKDAKEISYVADIYELNQLSNTLNLPLNLSDFKNHNIVEAQQVVRFKEGEHDNTDGVAYLVSNLITEFQWKQIIRMTQLVWNDYDDNVSFEETISSFKKEFKLDLENMIKEDCIDGWYDIFEAIMKHYKIEFKCIDMKTFVI